MNRPPVPRERGTGQAGHIPWAPRLAQVGQGLDRGGRPGEVLFLLDEDSCTVENDFTGQETPGFTAPHCTGAAQGARGARLPCKNIMLTGEPCAQMAESRLGGLSLSSVTSRGKWTLAGARLHLPHVLSQ